MSNHSVIEHRASYHFIKLEEDYIAICSSGEGSPHCKALILSVLEHWTNTKRDAGEGEYIYMTMPQWIKYTYMLYERNIITDCIAELLKEGMIERRSITMFNQKTFDYRLCTDKIQGLIRALPAKEKDDHMPNLGSYLTYKQRNKERREVERERVGEKSRTASEKSPTQKKGKGVGEKSPAVREKSRRGYVKNHHNLDTNTKIPTQIEDEVAHPLPSSTHPSLDDATQSSPSLSLSDGNLPLAEENAEIDEENEKVPQDMTPPVEPEEGDITNTIRSDVPMQQAPTTKDIPPIDTLSQQKQGNGVSHSQLSLIPAPELEQQSTTTEQGKKDAQPVKPAMPPESMKWGTRKCMMLFDYWRGRPLFVKYKICQASESAKGLATYYTQEQVTTARNRMLDDPYYADKTVDICDVANNIDRYLKKPANVPNNKSNAKSVAHTVQQPIDMAEARRLADEKNLIQLNKLRERQARLAEQKLAAKGR